MYNWLQKELFIKRAELDNNLSIQNIDNVLKMQGEQPGQGYLIQGPEVYDLQLIRQLAAEPNRSSLIRIRQLLINMFNFVAENLKDDSEDIEPDSSEIEDEIDSLVKAYASDHEFYGEELWEFISSLGENDKLRMWEGSVSQDLHKDIPASVQLVKNYINQIVSSGWDFSDYPIMNSLDIKRFENGLLDEDKINDFLGAYNLASITEAVMQPLYDFQNYSSYDFRREYPNVNPNNLPKENFPPWISEKLLKKYIRNNLQDEKADWYMNKYESSLRNDAIDSVNERNSEYFYEQKRELDHTYGFEVVETFTQTLEIDDTDSVEIDDDRLSLSLSTIFNIANSLQYNCYNIKGSTISAQIMIIYLLAIGRVASENESIKFAFSQDLNRIAPEMETIIRALTDISNTSPEYIPEEFSDNAIVQDTNNRLQDAISRAQEAKRIQEERHHMLADQTTDMSDEDMKRLKDLQISQHPFPHSYILERGRYPGAGFIIMPDMEPFRISVAPQGVTDIPEELFRRTTLHTTGDPRGKPALGWIGGYADYGNKILYVAEVQSDTMQRTVQMRDPRRVKRERKRRNIDEIRKLKTQVKSLETQLNSSISPTQKLQGIVDKIDAENATIPPNSAKWNENNNRKQQLLQQISNMSARGITSKTDTVSKQLEEAKRALQLKLEQGLNYGTEPRSYTGSFVKIWPEWHEYKSRVENRFKEWIPIFFNVAIREAQKRGFEAVRIIDSNTLVMDYGG